MPDVQRLRQGAIPAMFALAAGGSMLLITRVDTIEFSLQRPLYIVAGWLLIISAIGALVRVLDTAGLILLWNAMGWSAGLAVLGLESVGSMPLWPLMLGALALTFWPRVPGQSLPPAAIVIALAGGFAICWLGWADPIPASWREMVQ